MKSSMAKTVSSNDVSSPSWYKNQVIKKLWLMYCFCKVFIDQRWNSSLHGITWNAFRKVISLIKISYMSAIFLLFTFIHSIIKANKATHVLVGRFCIWSHFSVWAVAVRSKTAKTRNWEFDQQSGEWSRVTGNKR